MIQSSQSNRNMGCGNFLSDGGRRRTRRDWLKALAPLDRKHIGEDIKTLEFRRPIGMPVCKARGDGIYEVRTNLIHNRTARVRFSIHKKGRMVLLHGFIKKTQKPQKRI